MKPNGLWFSVEDGFGWADWCWQEEYELHKLNYASTITLNPNANILVVETKDDIQKLCDRYGYNKHSRPNEHDKALPDFMRWGPIVYVYQGIVIAPYVRAFRPMWLNSWDCSSGVIWDLRAIGSVRTREASRNIASRIPDTDLRKAVTSG